MLRNDTELEWPKNDKRLLFNAHGKQMEDLVAANAKRKKDTAKKSASPFDEASILKDREVDVWHYRDNLINPNQKKSWTSLSKHAYRCVFDVEKQTTRRLADAYVPQVTVKEGSDIALGRATKPYQRQLTWDGSYADYYLVDLATGKRKRALARQSGAVSLSPTGRYLPLVPTRSLVAARRQDQQETHPDPIAEDLIRERRPRLPPRRAELRRRRLVLRRIRRAYL